MTNQEAIEHGKEQLEIFGGTHREFIALAINALTAIDTMQKIVDGDVDTIISVLKGESE